VPEFDEVRTVRSWGGSCPAASPLLALCKGYNIRIIDCSWALGNRHVVNVGCEVGIHLGLVC